MKTVFITGAANGIGLATARMFARRGWYVGLYDINKAAVTELLTHEDFKNACGCVVDVADQASIENALAHFSGNTQGRMDLLVNNAGVSVGEPLFCVEHIRGSKVGRIQCQ